MNKFNDVELQEVGEIGGERLEYRLDSVVLEVSLGH